jgi:type IV pilus assembly protein PilW
VVCNPCTLDQLNNVVAAKVYVLARSLEVTPGYTDTKTYQLGSTTINPLGGGFKRHVFSTTVRLVNPSGRRES